MTSMFESEVYENERRFPWAHISATHFMRDMALDACVALPEAGHQIERDIRLSVVYRHDVASRFWWTISWLGENGVRLEESGQELSKCLWRAATRQKNLEEAAKKKKGAESVSNAITHGTLESEGIQGANQGADPGRHGDRPPEG